MPPSPQTEKGFQQAVIDYAHSLQWHVYHTYDSRRSVSGFPDLVLVRGCVIFAELKSDTGRLSLAQVEWMQALDRACQEVYVWRPRDWDQIEKTLSR